MLKWRASRAVAWSGGDLLLRQGVQFAAMLILARLLAPADFGVVAILALFIGIGSVLADGGFTAALIQRQDADHADESTVFWCNLVLSAAMALALVLSAPWLSTYLQVPVLKSLAWMGGLVVLTSALGAVHVALLAKRMDFQTQAKAGGAAALISCTLAVVLALRGHGVWALAWQAVTMSAINTLLLWRFHRWRPLVVWRVDSLRKLGSFGAFHLGSTLMEVIYSRLYALLLGRSWGLGAVGYYNNADYLRQLPANLLGAMVGRVALPVFASVGNERALLKRGMQLSLRVMMLVNAPLMLAGVVLAEPVILALLGSQWKPTIPVFQVLCLATVLYPLHLLNINLLLGRGHARLVFRLEVIKKILGTVLLLLGVQYGVLGIAWSQVIFSVAAFGINAFYAQSLIGYSGLAQIRDCLPSLILATGSSALLLGLYYMFPAPSLLMLVALACIGTAVYLAGHMAARTDAWRDAMEIGRSFCSFGTTGAAQIK